MKDKMQKDEILMPKSKAPSKKEDSLSLPNHIGSSNNLAYPLPLTHPPFILLRGITNLPTNHPIPFTNYSYILTILLITIITPFLYISYNQVPIRTTRTFPCSKCQVLGVRGVVVGQPIFVHTSNVQSWR
jgi:hypothetical protein